MIMHEYFLKELTQKLKAALKDNPRAINILKRYMQDKIAIVWRTSDVHRAANEMEMALTEREAMTVLNTLHRQHNRQLGLRWEDITGHIEAHVLGRKLTKREVKKFVQHDKLIIQR
jgi:hypothetical protein